MPAPAEHQQARNILDERSAARYLELSVSFLRKARRLGHGPAYLRFGRAVRYEIRALDSFCAERRVQ
jgi:hypothetical protein